MKYSTIKILGKELKCIEDEQGETYYPFTELSLLVGKQYLIHRSTLNKNYNQYLKQYGQYGANSKNYINKKGIIEMLKKGISYKSEFKDQVNDLYKYFDVKIPSSKTIKILEYDIKFIDKDNKIWLSINDINKKIFQKDKALSFNKYKAKDKKEHYIKIDEFMYGQNFNCVYIDEYLLKKLLVMMHSSPKFKNRYDYEKIAAIRLLKYYDILKTNNNIEINLDEQGKFIMEYVDIVPAFVKHIIRRKSFENFDNHFEDFIQEGYLALIESFRKYNIGKIEVNNGDFKGYLYKIIQMRMISYYNNMKHLGSLNKAKDIKTKLIQANIMIEKEYIKSSITISLEEACEKLGFSKREIESIIALHNIGSNLRYLEENIETDSEDSECLYDKIGSIDKEYQKVEDKIMVDKLLSSLNEQQLLMVKEYYYNYKTYPEISAKYNVPIHDVKKIINESIQIMRENI